jgi:hypothetical protein
MATLKDICLKNFHVPRNATRSNVYTRIMNASVSTQQKVRAECLETLNSGSRMHTLTSIGSQPGPSSNPLSRSEDDVQARTNRDFSPPIAPDEELLQNGFMRAPPKHIIDSSIVEFIDRTGNSAMAVGICAVCAREMNKRELTLHQINSFPNPHRLKPVVAHPHHDIFNGMLLHPAGLLDNSKGNICMDCARALHNDRMPSLALANGLWVGRIPHDLAYLTLPERLLIAKYFPAAYIIKLYPKKKGARHWDKRQMYSGLKGNVSTYQLDQRQITSMIDGTILPQQPRVLAATIGITFVGPKNLPDKALPDIFKVRRNRVRRALEWLKENNPLFSDITISELRLAELPENDIPYELRATTKLSTNVAKLHAEHDGYVPSQEASEDEMDEGKHITISVPLRLSHSLQMLHQARRRVSHLFW